MVQDQDQQLLMGSPRIHQDELSGGLILAPGSETTASVSEPLADIAGGKSGTEAEIENPYDRMSTAGISAGPSSSSHAVNATTSVASQPGQDAVVHDQSDTGVANDRTAAGGERGQEAAVGENAQAHSNEYSEQQQTQQAGSACKQS